MMERLRDLAPWIDEYTVVKLNVIKGQFICIAEKDGWNIFWITDDPCEYDNLINDDTADSEKDANLVYERWLEEARNIKVEPDWELQSEYDELHGTVNGGLDLYYWY